MEELAKKLKDQGLRLADTDNPDLTKLIDEDELEEARKNAG
jgi:hypothetical protein